MSERNETNAGPGPDQGAGEGGEATGRDGEARSFGDRQEQDAVPLGVPGRTGPQGEGGGTMSGRGQEQGGGWRAQMEDADERTAGASSDVGGLAGGGGMDAAGGVGGGGAGGAGTGGGGLGGDSQIGGAGGGLGGDAGMGQGGSGGGGVTGAMGGGSDGLSGEGLQGGESRPTGAGSGPNQD